MSRFSITARPLQACASLSDRDQTEWQRLHQVIRRATEERIPERFISFDAMARAIHHGPSPIIKSKRKRFITTAICAIVASAVAFAIYVKNKDDEADDETVIVETEQPTPTLLFSTPGLSTSSFNGSHAKSKCLAATLPGSPGERQ